MRMTELHMREWQCQCRGD